MLQPSFSYKPLFDKIFGTANKRNLCSPQWGGVLEKNPYLMRAYIFIKSVYQSRKHIYHIRISVLLTKASGSKTCKHLIVYCFMFWTIRTLNHVWVCQVTSNENLHVNYNLLRYTIDINHPYLVFNVTAWCQIWLNVVFIELLEFADVWTNNTYSFLGRHIKEYSRLTLAGKYAEFSTWNVFVVILDQFRL